MDSEREILALKRQVDALIKRSANPQQRPQIRRAEITEIGYNNVHKCQFVDGKFTEDITATDLTSSKRGYDVHVGDDYNLELDVGSKLMVALCDGQYWAIPGGAGSSGTPRIRFTILATSFSTGLGVLGCDYVTARVEHVSCGYTGVSVGDEVQIYDPEYCHFNLPIDLLVGLSGTATLMDSEYFQYGLSDVVDCLYELLAMNSCIWMIDTLCCAEEETLQ